MLAFILPRQNTGSVRRAGRGGDKGIFEAYPVSRQLINMRRFDNGVSRTAQMVCTMVIGEHDHDVWTRLLFGPGRPDRGQPKNGYHNYVIFSHFS